MGTVLDCVSCLSYSDGFGSFSSVGTPADQGCPTDAETQNFSFCTWIRLDETPAQFETVMSYAGNRGLTLHFPDAGATNWQWLSPGVGNTFRSAPAVGDWVWLGYTRNGTAADLYWANEGDSSLNHAGLTENNAELQFDATEFWMLGASVWYGVAIDSSFAGYREWFATLNGAEMLAEFQSEFAVRTSGLNREFRFDPGDLFNENVNGFDGSGNSGGSPVVGTDGPTIAATVTGTAAADVVFTAPALGAAERFGTAESTVGFTASAVGTRDVSGVATALLVSTFTASGAVEHTGTAESTLTYVSSAAGSVVGGATVTGTALSTFVFTTVGRVIPPAVDNIYDIVRNTIVAAGFRAYVGEATGRPEFPYAVVNADWEPEPDVGQPLLNIPSCQRVSMQINSYGRANRDALWLDATIYTILMSPEAVFTGTNVLWRDADDSPVLVRERYGPILCKHWYRIVYSREGT